MLLLRGRLDNQLGHLMVMGHKIWRWQYDLEKPELYHTKGAVMDIYTPAAGHVC